MMKKKLISLAMAMLLLVMAALPASAADPGFTDVKKGDWFYDAVQYTKDKGLFNGVTATTFAPDRSMTRAMFVQVLANQTKNYQKPAADEISLFMDVDKKEWYYPAVQWAAKNGIVNGKALGKFCPMDPVTREEMVKMLFQYAMMTGETTTVKQDALDRFTDKNMVSDWAKAPLQWAIGCGIIGGTGANIVNPKGSALRSHAANMFMNADSILTKKSLVSGVTGPAAPQNEAFKLLGQTFDEARNGKDITPVEFFGATAAYQGFAGSPDARVYYSNSDSDMIGAQYPMYMTVPAQNVFPDLAGKTLGEAFAVLGGASGLGTLSGTTDAVIAYTTKQYIFSFYIDPKTMTVSSQKPVRIELNRISPAIDLPSDRKLTYKLNGQDVFTVTLPESWKDCIVKTVSVPGEWDALYFYDPVSSLRYDSPGFGRLVYLTFHKSDVAPEYPLYEKVDTVSIDGTSYDLLAVLPSDVRWNPQDPESTASYTALRLDMHDFLDGIVIAPKFKGTK